MTDGVRHLLIKDLRILRRSPAIVVLLVVYPAIVAALIGFAIGRGPQQPRVAVVNEIPGYASTFLIGGEEVDVRRYLKMIDRKIERVDVSTRAEAIAAVRSGDAIAALIVPRRLVDELQGGLSRGYVDVIYRADDPIRRSYVETTMDGLMVDVNRELSDRFTRGALGYLDVVVKGGEIEFGPRAVKVIGLNRAEATLKRMAARLPPKDQRATADLTELIGLARQGLDRSDELLEAVGEPVVPRRKTIGHGGRSTLSTYAVAATATISLMFVALLVAAGMLALEREEQVFTRLSRSLVSPLALVAEKATLAAACATGVGGLTLLGLSALIQLQWSRAALWPVALVAGAMAFGAAGVALGAVVREVRAASLATLTLGIPLAAMALVPAGAVGATLYDALRVVSALFPFRPTLRLIEGALGAGEPMLAPALHLVALTAMFGLIALVGVHAAVRRG